MMRPDDQVQLDLASFLLGARSIEPPYIKVAVIRPLNDEAGTLEVCAQSFEQGKCS